MSRRNPLSHRILTRADRDPAALLGVALGVIAAGVLAAGLGLLGCAAGTGPPLAGGVKIGSKPASNADCLTCHMDFKTELIARRHAEAGIGCASCHGESQAHGDDEMNITPPDVLFGRAEIAGFCRQCHKTHEAGKTYAAFVKQWQGKRRPNGRMILPTSVCTDCHGNHAVLPPDKQITIE